MGGREIKGKNEGERERVRMKINVVFFLPKESKEGVKLRSKVLFQKKINEG